MAATTSAPPREEVVFRHRRRPPVLAFGIVGAGFLGALAFGAQSPWARAGFLVLAALALALGILGRRRYWLEDQLVTATSVAVVRRDGTSAEIPFERIDRIALRGGGMAFVRDDGRELAFARNPHRKRLERLLGEIVPAAQWVDEVPIACDT